MGLIRIPIENDKLNLICVRRNTTWKLSCELNDEV